MRRPAAFTMLATGAAITMPDGQRSPLLGAAGRRQRCVGVLHDEVASQIFREHREIEVGLEAVGGSLPRALGARIEDGAKAQERRWDEWPSIRESSLR